MRGAGDCTVSRHGHTVSGCWSAAETVGTGNCIVAFETDGLFWPIHGDVTYTDVALCENKLSVVFEDLAAVRKTLGRCRAIGRARPTVWLGPPFRGPPRRLALSPPQAPQNRFQPA